MDGPRDYHIKWSKSDREMQIYDITYYMWNLKYNTNEPICKTETDSQKTYGYQRGKWGGINYRFGISRNKLLCMK